jgi:acetoin utilization deacetylase AcuC-like enzyme
MKKEIIFHEDFYQIYANDPAASPGRMEAIIAELYDFQIISLEPAQDKDILLVHSEAHLSRVKNDWEQVYSIAALSAGGAVLASEYALEKNPIFAVIRPPGHHASPEGYWGFCYLNNIAIAIQKLLNENRITNAVIIDFDLHFGDGTNNTFSSNAKVNYYSGQGRTNEQFIQNMKDYLSDLSGIDILGVSAGFDRGIDDWGGLLTIEDYHQIGKILKAFSTEECSDRRFAVLEGGYNHKVLGKNVRAFIEGFY